MKITKSKLMKIIKEELTIVLESTMYGPETTNIMPRERIPKRYRHEDDEPTFDSPERSSIGVADDPGENPLSYRVQQSRKRHSDDALGINRKPLRPEEAKAHEILKRAGFRGRRRGDERVDLFMTHNKGWNFSEYAARNILYKAADAGEISQDTAYNVMMSLERELYDTIADQQV